MKRDWVEQRLRVIACSYKNTHMHAFIRLFTLQVLHGYVVTQEEKYGVRRSHTCSVLFWYTTCRHYQLWNGRTALIRCVLMVKLVKPLKLMADPRVWGLILSANDV